MLASSSAMLAPALEKTSPSGCLSLFSPRALAEPGSASRRSAESFAITTAQSELTARRERGAASRSGYPPERHTGEKEGAARGDGGVEGGEFGEELRARGGGRLRADPSVGDALDLARTLHAISPARPILLARSALDIGVDALVRAGVADLVRRPLVGAELASVLSRCLASAKTLGAAHNNAS